MELKMLKIKSSPCQILAVETYLQRVATTYKVSPERYPDMLISLTEAVNNAIFHGNKADKDKFVKIKLKEKESGLAFHVSDEGKGFNPESVPDPTADEHLECCGGRGVFIMSSLADRVNYHNNGSTVEMYFKLS